jgi:1-phosphatidylinositol-3-phosphate 5-kinase
MFAEKESFKETQSNVKVELEVGVPELVTSAEAQNGSLLGGTDGSREDFPPSPSDHHSILVSFSSSCLEKRRVCERCLLYRIKYYGSFDKPLGKFLKDDVFDPVSSGPTGMWLI